MEQIRDLLNPPSITESDLVAAWSQLKNFIEPSSHRKAASEAVRKVIGLAIFVPTSEEGAMKNYIGAADDRYDMPPYASSEVFLMLASHYPPSGLSGRGPLETLKNLVDYSLVERVYDEHKPLRTIMADLKVELLQLLEEQTPEDEPASAPPLSLELSH